MFHRILIPLDGSTLAERAIPHAEAFARIFGASIVLIRVLEVTTDHENQASIDPLNWQIRKTEADLYLRGIASRIQAHLVETEKIGGETANQERVEYVIREGRTAENIIDFAHTENIDLLVISSHGSGGLSRWNTSSVIQKVIDLVYLPLLIVRSYDQQEETNEPVHYQRILLPIDSSRRAEHVLSAGIVLAQGETLLQSTAEGDLSRNGNASPEGSIPKGVSLKPKLFLTSVITPPEIPLPKPYPADIEKLSDQLLHVSREAVLSYLSEVKQRLPVESEIRVIEGNNVASAIQELADQEDMDLILISAHGYTGQFTYPYGNVARSSIERGTKSILVLQDVPLAQVRSTVAALAAEKSGIR